MERPKTICARCRYYREEGPMWYSQFCAHPDIERGKIIDPVTGKEGFAAVNSVGDRYLADRPEPYARDINQGNCRFFEPRRDAAAGVSIDERRSLMSMSNLIKALQIFLKYGDPEWPTHCEHDELWICGIDPEAVSDEDKAALDALGFFVHDEGFKSFRYGSA